MYIRKFVPILFVYFCLLLGGQVSLPAAEAYDRWCCGCNSQSWCAWYTACHCPGLGGCMWCAAPDTDLETVQSTPSVDDPSADQDMRDIRVSVLSTATERVLSDLRGSLGHANFSLERVENMENGLRFRCPDVADKYIQGNIVFARAGTQQ